MDPVYVLNPDLWKAYIPPSTCPLCGCAMAEGIHRQLEARPDGSAAWVCRVTMLCNQPLYCTHIDGTVE